MSQTARLVYWPDFQSFSTKVETLVELKEFTQPATGNTALIGKQTRCPYLELTHESEGLQIAVMRAGSYEPETVTMLPWSVFESRQGRYGRLSEKQQNTQLTRYGWTKELRNQDFPEAPFRLEHRFFEVSWSYI